MTETEEETKSLKTATKKKKRKNHSNLGPNFVAPDGGFGWLICIAAGLSNLFSFQPFQQFGLLYRDRLLSIDISSSEITTIINTNQAAQSLIGLANGPLFRRFSYRQVGFVGAMLVTLGILFSAYADSFILFLITLSIIYGSGVGLTTSSNSLALNTYFKERRRIVTGLSWTVTGMGPIMFPFIVTHLLPIYGVTGTVLIFAGIAMNTICCACLLQPVMWHVKDTKSTDDCQHCRYLFSADVVDAGTPMLARANDGWYSSSSAKRSLYSSKLSLSSTQNLSNRKVRPQAALKSAAEKDVLDAAKGKLEQFVSHKCNCVQHEAPVVEENFTFWHKVVIFFDLDLMRDLTYLNIMLGLILAHFAEVNFSVLTPFVLTEFGFEKTEIATCIAVTGIMDTVSRFTVPFAAGFVGFDNRTFYLIGIFNMSLGRIAIAHFHTYPAAIAIFVWIGFNKGLRTVFMNLCIPSHVPIDRLPAATGLHLLFSGIFYILFGPFVGYIRDKTDYTIALHCLNIASFACVISWIIEMVIVKRRQKMATKIDVVDLELK